MFFVSAGPCVGMHTHPSLPLPVTRRREPEEQALCEAERKGETLKQIKGREGHIVVRRRGVPIIKVFWMRARVVEHMGTYRNNCAASRSRCERRGALWGVAAADVYSASSCSDCTGTLSEPTAGQSQSSGGIRIVQTVTLSRMQGLSSRAHAFSVEALVGKPCKRLKLSEGHESSSAGDTGCDGSILIGETQGQGCHILKNISLFGFCVTIILRTMCVENCKFNFSFYFLKHFFNKITTIRI